LFNQLNVLPILSELSMESLSVFVLCLITA